MWKQLNQSRRLSVVIYLGIFVLLLVCNMLTPYAVDDFSYVNNFATGEPLSSVWEIIPSMAAHAQLANGRLSAHSLVQVFVLLPRWVFDVVNAAVFCLLIGLLTGMDASGERNNLLTIGAFCALWLYEPAFGQVNLWQDGAINYLWSVVAVLAFLFPFGRTFLHPGKRIKNTAAKVCFLLFSFFAGSYSETVSAAGIFMAACLVLLDAVCNKQRVKLYDIGCIAMAFFGNISIYLAPAQWMNKSAEFSVMNLFMNIVSATEQYETFGILLIAYAVLLVFNICEETDARKIWLSVVLVLGSLAANYIMIFAAYYPSRSAVGAVCLLIAADMVLLRPMIGNKRRNAVAVSALAVLVLMTVPEVLRGGKDIAATWMRMTQNETRILESKENGDLDVEVPNFYPVTKYSAIHDLKYLDMEDASSWPNHAMAKYYGVDSIIGVPWNNETDGLK